MVSNIYLNSPRTPTARLPHPGSGDIQGQKTYVAPFADKQTHKYDTNCSNLFP